ncbi:hypothetical protein Naga_100013g5 [Nannochloropsis gaditana]|uniref:Uncharacterized protein n=1 Tax=Nannochloropsis gaditana TaxID=72520 RepID=W7UCJ0_9STRA|nr:hypothetical protein Naga_100013g5 [Nannochloropsis gaditana]
MSPYLLYRRHTDSDKDAETLAIWFHSEKDRVHIAGCLQKVLRLHSSVDPKQQDQWQAQERESLLGSALPPAPTLTDLSRVDNTEAMKSRTTSTSAETTKEKKPTAIEDLLLKAASLGGGSAITRPELDRKADTLTTSPARRAAAASPPAITNMLLRPKVATAHAAPAAETGRPTCTNGSGRGPGQGSIVSTLLNPLGMVRPISNSTCSDSGNGGTISPARSLDKQQLKEALLALLEEDAFLETLHRAYLRRRTE